jgi:nucleotide-binding universal stress UspA family protein
VWRLGAAHDQDRRSGSALELLASEWRAELVVCSSRGRGRIRAAGLGSVSRRLLGRAGASVIVVPPPAAKRWDTTRGEPASATLRSLVCGVDGSIAGYEAVQAAAHIAASSGARLTLVHAYLPAPPIARTRSSVINLDALSDSERSSRSRLLHRAAALAGERIEVATRLESDAPAIALEAVAGEQRAGLLVVGARARGRLASALLGSTSAALASSASRPVLVIRDGQAANLSRLESDREPRTTATTPE